MAQTSRVTLERAFLALISGAILGAFLTAIAVIFPALAEDPSSISPLGLTLTLLRIFAPAFIGWLAGLVIVGAPLWAGLHAYGFRGYGSAVVLGFALCLFGSMVPTVFGPTFGIAYPEAFPPQIVLALIGAFAALLIRFMAYRDN